MRFKSILTASIFLVFSGPMAIADAGDGAIQIEQLKTPTVRGMKDGKMSVISADELELPLPGKKKGAAYEISWNGHIYKIRAMDVVVEAGNRSCRPGEAIVVASTTSIGASQMGNDSLECE